MAKQEPPFCVGVDETTARVNSVRLYGRELLDAKNPAPSEIRVNDIPLKTRSHPADPAQDAHNRMKGEHFIGQLSGWSLVAMRSMGQRWNSRFKCFGVTYNLRRELCDMTDLQDPGPGGPVIEAPMWIDTIGLMNWNWKFWGDETRMIFPSSHTNGPAGEYAHIGYENDAPEVCKSYMQNVWRRIYPGCMVIHGGVFYNDRTGHWIAITCRRPHVGYMLNIETAGRGVGYDFTLHDQFEIGDRLRMPEVKIYYGKTREEMMEWMGWYVTFYYEETPEWTYKTLWGGGFAWDNQPTWTQQADLWEKQLDAGDYSGIGYCLVTNREVISGTTPTGYEPDPNHGTQEEFKQMCRRVTDRGVPLLIWMSHSGLSPGAHEIDDDWFIRGVDGQISAGWGSRDAGMMMCNPGHPGYIEYTKKWIRFYMQECGCKGIFFDCLGWAFPTDFEPRDFMRYPGDTNLMTIRFMEEIYACIKECDPEGILLGEGVSLDGPVNIFTIAANPVRAIDGMGPRDFLLDLNRYSPKRMTIDQGGDLFPSSGMCVAERHSGSEKRNRFMVELLNKKGGRDAFTHLVGDLSVIDDLLFVPFQHEQAPGTPFYRPTGTFKLPPPYDGVTSLKEHVEGQLTIRRGRNGTFNNVPAGIYRMISGRKKP